MTDDEIAAREVAFVITGLQGGYRDGWRDGVAYATEVLTVPTDRCNACMTGGARCERGADHDGPHSFGGRSG